MGLGVTYDLLDICISEGMIIDNMRVRKGRIIDSNGSHYLVHWKLGYQIYKFYDEKYSGEWKEGKRHGLGKIDICLF